MAMRTIRVSWKTKDGIIKHCAESCNDGQSDQQVAHSLEADGRYLVSPIAGIQPPMADGHGDVILKQTKRSPAEELEEVPNGG